MEWIYKYISVTAVIAGVGFLIKYLIQRKIDSYFNKRLEDHKQELAVMTERSKYDISKKLFDFEAYAAKKHTIYPELYQRMFAVQRKLTIFIYNVDKKGIVLKDLTSYEKDKEMKEVHATIDHALDYFIENELYLSKNIISIFWKTWNLIKNFQSYLYDEKYESSFVQEELAKIKEKIETLKEVIYEELSYSHFEKTEEKV